MEGDYLEQAGFSQEASKASHVKHCEVLALLLQQVSSLLMDTGDKSL